MSVEQTSMSVKQTSMSGEQYHETSMSVEQTLMSCKETLMWVKNLNSQSIFEIKFDIVFVRKNLVCEKKLSL